MRRRQQLLAFCILGALAAPFEARGVGDPDFAYSWPCNGSAYGNVVLIAEGQFPGSNPRGLTGLSGLQVNVHPETRRALEIETVTVLRNRRGNRPEGYELKLARGVFAHAGSHFTPSVVEFLEGDVVSIGMKCTPVGKVPKRWFNVLYTVDLFDDAPTAAQEE